MKHRVTILSNQLLQLSIDKVKVKVSRSTTVTRAAVTWAWTRQMSRDGTTANEKQHDVYFVRDGTGSRGQQFRAGQTASGDCFRQIV